MRLLYLDVSEWNVFDHFEQAFNHKIINIHALLQCSYIRKRGAWGGYGTEEDQGCLLILRLFHNTTSTDKLLKFGKMGAYWHEAKDMRGVFKRLIAEHYLEILLLQFRKTWGRR
jgi:hypothetical protein